MKKHNKRRRPLTALGLTRGAFGGSHACKPHGAVSVAAMKTERRKRAVLRSVLAAKGDPLAGYREYADCIYNIKTLLMVRRASIIDIVRAADRLDEDLDLAGAIAEDIEALGFDQKGGAK